MRFVSWNVNGLRACMQKGFMDFFSTVNADFFCLQETKLQEGQIDLDLPGYEQYWCYAEKKGYSGTAIFTKHTPLSVTYGMGIPELDTEGRLITLEYPEFYLVTCYTPNAQRGLARIDHRMKWEAAFRAYVSDLDSKKPVILCGDLNVAHKEIDLKNPASNRGNAGFSDEERDAFSKLLDCGFADSFRHLHPETVGAYTWWSYMFNARQNNAGWRIDYFVVSNRLKEQLFSTPIYSDILGSDHCPVGLDMDILCNGGIWPSFEAAETTPKAEEKTEKKSSGVKAAATLLCAASVLASIYFLVPGSTPNPPSTSEPSATEDYYRPPGDNLFSWSVARNELSYTFSSAPIFSSVLKINAFRDGTKVYPIDEVSIPAELNFWVRIDAFDAAELIGCDLHAAVLDSNYLQNGHPESHAFVHVTKYQDDRGIFAGWFVYGYIQRDSLISIELSDDSVVLQKATIPVSPILSAEAANVQSTYGLVEYAVHLEAMDAFVANDDAVMYLETFMDLWPHFPALLELTFREDAAIILAEHASLYPSCADTVGTLTLLINHISQQYIGYKDAPIPSVMETSELISHVSEQEQLIVCINDLLVQLENYSVAYHALRCLQPAVAELENREDAAAELLKRYGESQIINFLFVQPVFMSELSIYEAAEFVDKLHEGDGIETVSTDNLAMVITSVFHVNSSLQFSYPYSYAQLCQAFPPLQEFEKREDAHTVLLAYLTESNGIITETQKSTASLLLYQEPFYSRLDEWQLEILERGGPILYGDTIIEVPDQSHATP